MVADADSTSCLPASPSSTRWSRDGLENWWHRSCKRVLTTLTCRVGSNGSASARLRRKLTVLTQIASRTTARGQLPFAEDVHGVVLAGVFARRQARFDALRPRPLLPVAGVALVTYAMRWLAEGGLSGILCCTNAAARAVRDVTPFAADEGVTLRFLEDWLPRGSAGCVRDAAERTSARSLVVVESSVVPTADLAQALATHREAGAALTLVTHEGKGTGAPVAGGICIIERDVLEKVPATGFHDIKEVLIPLLTRLGERVAIHHAPGVPARVVDFASYLALNRWVLAGREGEGARVASGAGPLFADPTARVANGVRVIGPVQLGPGVVVETGAILVGPAVISGGTKVGRGAVVSRSVIWEDCCIGADAEVDLCVVADGVSTKPRAQLYGSLVADRSPIQAPASGHHQNGRESPEPRWARPWWRTTPASSVAASSR